ncbi:MAG: hypothetical protein NTV56_18165 [Alphaproteobacteria bacterium]|nr:hypothetical protein [Alphaproteobacteria bacterium]
MQRFVVWAACAAGVFAVSSAQAQEQFIGRWAANPELCSARGGDSAANSALVATDTSLWWFDGYCRIGKMYKAKAVYVQAHCSKGDVSVTMDAQGGRMRVTWGGAKPEELKRCN